MWATKNQYNQKQKKIPFHKKSSLSKFYRELVILSVLFLSCKAAAAAKSLQSCLTLCDPTDSSPPGSPIPGILQARTLEWVAISFSNACKWKVKVKTLSRIRPSATPWIAAFQAPPSMGFSRQEHWSGVPLPSQCLKYLKNRLKEQDNTWRKDVLLYFICSSE